MSSRPKNQSSHFYDDLTLIKGIKEARQQWLRETFNVRSFADLAALSVDKIHAQLKKEQIVSQSEIKSWIQQAQKFAASRQWKSDLGENGWTPIASFVVEYQKNEQTSAVRTNVHHMEADKTMFWPDIKQHEACHWMFEQLDLSIASEPPLLAEKAMPIATQTAEPDAALIDNYQSLSGQLQQVIEALTKAGIMPVTQAMAIRPPMLDMKPASTFNERRQKAFQKATTVLSTPQPAVEPAAQTKVKSPLSGVLQSGYSDELQRLMSKVQRLSKRGTT